MKNSEIFRFAALIALCCCAAVASCVEDKGNYTYLDPSDVLSVKIEGFGDVTAMNYDNLKITPDLKNDGGRQYTYSWYVTPTSPGGIMPQKTVLSSERNLDVTLKLEPRSYFLYFEVFDPARNNVSVRRRVVLKVTETEINSGWYVLKDVGGETDFDYVNEAGELYSNVLVDHAGGERLAGRPLQIVYQQGRYSHRLTLPDGRDTLLENRSALHILSDRGLRTLDASSLLRYKDFDEQFYKAPATCNPMSISLPSYNLFDLYLNNDGKVYAISGDVANVGKYSGPKAGFYNAHRDMISVMSGVAFFDTEERTFYWTGPGTGANIVPVDDSWSGSPSPYKMDCTLVNMFVAGDFYGFEKTGHAVMRGISDNKYYLFGIAFDPLNVAMISPTGGYEFLTSFAEIPDGCRMPRAEVKAGCPAGGFIYFGDANKLCVYRNLPETDEQEDVLVTFPEGETVGHILCRDLTGTEGVVQCVVLTNGASGWKLYVYELAGYGNPELRPEPAFTYSGTGTGRYVIYREGYSEE